MIIKVKYQYSKRDFQGYCDFDCRFILIYFLECLQIFIIKIQVIIFEYFRAQFEFFIVIRLLLHKDFNNAVYFINDFRFSLKGHQFSD